ncbi:MAG TPA: VWA domain-containing protein [Solirubrobacteraceae bacterium]|nr:VWA domain-containing protein [Solirubrobacteraceae bacterium]
MKRGQLVILLFAAIAVAAIAFTGGGGDDGGTASRESGDAPAKAPAGALRISFPYSPEKEPLLKPLIERFNASRTEAAGKVVFVEGRSESSGVTEQRVAQGRDQPVAWSPASSLWGRLLNFEADRPLVPDENPSIVRTPLVIAMWEPMAKALGHPDKPIGFEDIVKLARSKAGWADYGLPEYGAFKLVHTNPDYSTSGLSAVVAEYYAATGKKEGLRPEDVTGKARDTVRAIERSIVHYGDITPFIAEQMRKGGLGYASAVAMEEATLLDFNAKRGKLPKLVAIYPKEGTFFSDSPFIVLDGDWVTPEQREGALAFQKFLAKEITPEVAARGGFRPADLETKAVAPVSLENGADPDQPARELGLPEPRVLALLKRTWREDRKPANVLLVLDTSGSMGDESRLDNAKDGLKVFLEQVAPQDRVGLTTFSDQITPLVPVGPFRQNKGELQQTISRLIPEGGTAFYDAAAEGFSTVRDLAGRDDRINAVVLLTDGEDTDSTRDVDAVVNELKGQGDSSTQVRVFTIAYSAGAAGAREALEKIAEASGGKSYPGDPENIEAVYRSISSFF